MNKRIKLSTELFWILGTVFVAFGVSLCSKADLGVSMIAAPAFVFSDAIKVISVGVAEYLIQGLLLIVMCLAVKRFSPKYLLAFLVAVIYGYTIDLFIWLTREITLTNAFHRWLMLLVGDSFVALGVACFFRTYLPLQVYELFVKEVSSTYSKNINRVKWVFDLTLLIASLTLAFTLFGDVKEFNWAEIWHTSFHSIGLGTIVTTLINSPLIALAGKILDKFFTPTVTFNKLEKILK